jgi:hypothetical protein
MLKKAVIIPLFLAAIAGGGTASVGAAPSCVTVQVIAPVLGDRTVTRCVPGPFTRPFFFSDCVVVPPAGVTVCLTIDAHTP